MTHSQESRVCDQVRQWTAASCTARFRRLRSGRERSEDALVNGLRVGDRSVNRKPARRRRVSATPRAAVAELAGHRGYERKRAKQSRSQKIPQRAREAAMADELRWFRGACTAAMLKRVLDTTEGLSHARFPRAGRLPGCRRHRGSRSSCRDARRPEAVEGRRDSEARSETRWRGPPPPLPASSNDERRAHAKCTDARTQG